MYVCMYDFKYFANNRFIVMCIEVRTANYDQSAQACNYLDHKIKKPRSASHSFALLR